MVGGNHFRPEPKRRAPDPSLEEMLRRARDAPLGDDLGTTGQRGPHFTPLHMRPRLWPAGSALPSRVVFWVGVVTGALVMYLVTRASPFAGSAAPQLQQVPQTLSPTSTAILVTPTDTPLPTATDVPTPTPADVPTATPTIPAPPTTGEIASLAQQFYDNQSSYAGTYVFVDATTVQIESQDGADLTVCVAFEYATTAAPTTVIGTDTRPFTLTASSAGVWQAVQVGDAGSCSLG